MIGRACIARIPACDLSTPAAKKDLVLPLSFRHPSLLVFQRLILLVFALLAAAPALIGQEAEPREVDKYLAHGEFSLALEQTSRLPATVADQTLNKIALAQMFGGAAQGAWRSAGQIQNGQLRNQTLGGMFQLQPTAEPHAGRGGITAADYQPLIDLIQSTIAPDEWAETGNGDGTIQPWPAGVYVDAKGSLQRIKIGNSGNLSGIAETLRTQPSGIEDSSTCELRVISLRQLERAAELAVARHEPLSPWITHLCGLTSIKYVVAQPERQDILLVGPAGPWKYDQDGRAIQIATGLPILQLDDLVTALRNARDWNGIFGCSITPRADRLAAAKEFLASTSLTGTRFREELRTTLGQQDIEVFGIAPDSHLAQVLVEADYRMKLVGMGIEPSIPEVPSYFERVKLLPDGSAPPLDVARWWFTLNYDQLQVDEARLVYSFTGTGVKVLAETEFINAGGERIHTGKAIGPTKGFAEDFTKHFEKMARKYPIYNQLRGAFDLALVAAIIEREQLSARSGWEPTFFASESSGQGLHHRAASSPTPKTVDSVMNHRVIRARNGNKTQVHTLIGVSGGVHCDFTGWMKSSAADQAQVQQPPESIRELFARETAGDRWWWD